MYHRKDTEFKGYFLHLNSLHIMVNPCIIFFGQEGAKEGEWERERERDYVCVREREREKERGEEVLIK